MTDNSNYKQLNKYYKILLKIPYTGCCYKHLSVEKAAAIDMECCLLEELSEILKDKGA